MNALDQLLDMPRTGSTQKDKPYWEQYKAGNKYAAAPLLKELEPTIESAIHAFAADDPAYKTQARILALEAVKSYDPGRGANIRTHVYNNLKRLQRISAHRGNLIRISENASLQRSALAKARRDYEIDHGEEPTVEELATLTGISRKRIDDLANYRPVVADSLAVNPEGDSFHAVGVNKALELYDRYIYDDLDRIDKKIYEWSTGYGGTKQISRAEMAKKLNISQAAVSQRASKISLKFNQDRETIRKTFYGGAE